MKKNSIARKLYLGFSALILILMITGLTLGVNMRGIVTILEEITEIKEPASTAASGLEVKVAEASVEIFKYLDTGAAEQRRGAAKEIAGYEQYEAVYTRLGKNPADKKSGEQLSSLFQQFKKSSSSLMNLKDEQEALLVSINRNFIQLDEMLDEKLEPSVDRRAPDGFVKIEAILHMEIKSAEVDQWLGHYFRDPKKDYQDLILKEAADFSEELAKFKRLRLTPLEKRHIDEVTTLWGRIMPLVRNVLRKNEALRANLSSFIDLGERMDIVLDEDIHVRTRGELADAKLRAQQTAGMANRAIVLMLVLGLVVGLGAADLMGRGILGSLRRLVEGTEKIGAGALDYRIQITSGDEIEELAASFNRMTQRRQEAEAALQKNHDELEARVAARTAELSAANIQLQEATAEADKANAAKSEFLSRMSHELRTPLNAILGFGQILDKEKLDPLSKESVGHILKGGRHLLDLINEVLDIARVEAGHIDLSLEAIALDDVVPEACALVAPLAAEHHIRLSENTSELSGSYILADRQRLKQVLINLLSNAIKYNREGGQVEVICHTKPEGWTSIAVCDTGYGISPQDLLKLFTPFERLSAGASDIEGTGLGLVLSQSLMTAMGGTLKVKSTLGQGTTFTIELPQATEPGKQLANMSQKAGAADERQEVERAYSVLCIEDNPSNLRLLEVIFNRRPGIRLLTAIQGSVGLDLARQHEPDLILLDLNLPDIQGAEVLARLQQSALTRDIPVVVLSADATPNQIERLLAAGARDYLTKPLNVDQFLDTLDKFRPLVTTHLAT